MIVRRIEIENFRGIRKAGLSLSKHVLLVGTNNVGKSTVLEALDLVLGPERLGRQNPIQEHDFYDGKYLSSPDRSPVSIRIHVTLADLDDEAQRAFRNHLEWWDTSTKKTLNGEAAAKIKVGDKRYSRALRVAFRAQYDRDEDEFVAETFFSHPPVEDGVAAEAFGRKEKRMCGFLYLRSLRTGSRALSLEKGTLFDTILQLKGVQAGGLWEDILEALREVGPTLGQHEELRNVLNSIETHVNRYIPLARDGNATDLQVTELTREHLRRSVAFFLKSEPSTTGVPFQHSGSGTLNVLVLALLSFIAEQKKSVIFAMEEPETALPPYTQRRIAQLAKATSTQCILTSHSPYVAECFVPNDLLVLRRSGDHELTVAPIATDAGIKRKTLQREFRLRFAEGVMSRGILAVEGISELWAIPVASELLATSDPNYSHLDLSGVAVIERGGDGGLESLGRFFRGLGIRTFAFFDRPNDLALRDRLEAAFDHCTENSKSGIERLLTEELPLERIRGFLDSAAERHDFPHSIDVPDEGAPETAIRKYAFEVLKHRKGEAYAAELLRTCTAADLPCCLTALLMHISKQMGDPPRSGPSLGTGQ